MEKVFRAGQDPQRVVVPIIIIIIIIIMPEREADYSSTRAEVKKSRVYISTPHTSSWSSV
jgi:hypothetical protein